MSGTIHAWRRDVRTVIASYPGADRKYGTRAVDWCKSCGDSVEALRLSSMPWSGREGNRTGRRNFFVELRVARLVYSELLTVRHCGHRCAGPFVSRNLEA
jgi:hypothetical protein